MFAAFGDKIFIRMMKGYKIVTNDVKDANTEGARTIEGA